MTGREPVQRSWLEVRWRQLRNPPPPVVRAVLANLAIAGLGGAALLVHALSAGPGDSIFVGALLFVVGVAVVGSTLTYVWVELPSGASGARRRSAWAALLGLFASLPIAYLVIVVVLQVVAPALR